jgi:hypothetical protein
MAILGLILLVVAAGAIIGVFANGGTDTRLDLGLFHADTTVAGVFIAGAATLLIAVLGLWLLKAGLARTRRRRQEVKALRNQAANQRVANRRDAPSTGAAPQPGGAAPTERRPGDDPDQHFDSAPRER